MKSNFYPEVHYRFKLDINKDIAFLSYINDIINSFLLEFACQTQRRLQQEYYTLDLTFNYGSKTCCNYSPITIPAIECELFRKKNITGCERRVIQLCHDTLKTPFKVSFPQCDSQTLQTFACTIRYS